MIDTSALREYEETFFPLGLFVGFVMALIGLSRPKTPDKRTSTLGLTLMIGGLGVILLTVIVFAKAGYDYQKKYPRY